MDKKYTIGVDPGNSGAISLLEDGRLLDVWDMPLVPKISGKGNEISPVLLCEIVEEVAAIAVHQWVENDTEVEVIFEQVHSMPRQGVASTFAFGKAFGLVIGVFAARGWPMRFVTPQNWKRKFGLIGKDKDASRGLVLSMFPEKAHDFRLKKHNGRSDATLIGLM